MLIILYILLIIESPLFLSHSDSRKNWNLLNKLKLGVVYKIDNDGFKASNT